MKSTFKIIKNLTIGLSFKMFWTLISKPLFLLPTVWATIESILFSQLNFNENHGGQGRANAFRHAAWNLLIARNLIWITSPEKAVARAKYITDLHEECFPNEDFDREMDLHNNAVGRNEFLYLLSENIKSKPKMIQHLVAKTKTAQGLVDEKEFEKFPNEMVFLKTWYD